MDAITDPRLISEVAQTDRPSRDEAMAAVRTLLRWAGDNPDREGLIDTPKRVVEAYREFFAGYEMDPAAELSRTFEDVQGYDDIVMLRDIDLESHCEHHMVPILGRAHIAYMPTNAFLRLPALSKSSASVCKPKKP
ncbi:MAG: hypothetical protein RL230_3152 [Pseudomonadota bacterium]